MHAAYRRLARERHPDRGGSANAFVQLNCAYRKLLANFDLTAQVHSQRARGAAARTMGVAFNADGTARRVSFDPDELQEYFQQMFGKLRE